MSQLQHPTNRGVGISNGRTSASNLNGGLDSGLQQTSQPSPGATILDTLKKKMNQLKEELEISKDESERSRQNLDEEKRRREVVRDYIVVVVFFVFPMFLSSSLLSLLISFLFTSRFQTSNRIEYKITFCSNFKN